MIGILDPLATVVHIVLRRAGDLVDGRRELFLHMLRHQDADDVHEDDHRKEVGPEKAPHTVPDIFQRDVRENERYRISAAVFDRHAAGAQPAVILCFLDRIDLAAAVRIQEIVDFFFGDRIPVHRCNHCFGIIVRVDHIDQRFTVAVIHREVDVVDVDNVGKIAQHLADHLIIVALCISGKTVAVLFRTGLFPLVVGQRVILRHNVVRDRLDVDGLTQDRGGAFGKVKGFCDILVHQGVGVDGQPDHQSGKS